MKSSREILMTVLICVTLSSQNEEGQCALSEAAVDSICDIYGVRDVACTTSIKAHTKKCITQRGGVEDARVEISNGPLSNSIGEAENVVAERWPAADNVESPDKAKPSSDYAEQVVGADLALNGHHGEQTSGLGEGSPTQLQMVEVSWACHGSRNIGGKSLANCQAACLDVSTCTTAVVAGGSHATSGDCWINDNANLCTSTYTPAGDGINGVAKAWEKQDSPTAAPTAAAPTASPTCHGIVGTDAGAGARCSNTRCGYTPGTLDCEVQMHSGCSVKSGWKHVSSAECTTHFGYPITASSCEDGGVNAAGVYMTYGSTAGGYQPYCAAWDGKGMPLSMMECGTIADGSTVCTKAAAIHVHYQSIHAGILVMKRLKCKDSVCVVYKSGACFDVGSDVFEKVTNDQVVEGLFSRTQDFAALVVAQLIAGTSQKCTGNDANLGSLAIKGF